MGLVDALDFSILEIMSYVCVSIHVMYLNFIQYARRFFKLDGNVAK